MLVATVISFLTAKCLQLFGHQHLKRLLLHVTQAILRSKSTCPTGERVRGWEVGAGGAAAAAAVGKQGAEN